MQPDQLVTSINVIVERFNDENMTTQKVKTALLRFEKLRFLTNKLTNKNRLITIVNWENIKMKIQRITSNLTGTQQATNKQLTTK